jgi:hypothetical protein
VGDVSGDGFLTDARDATPAVHTEPSDPVWAFAFDDQGAMRGAWCGPAALRIVVDAPG